MNLKSIWKTLIWDHKNKLGYKSSKYNNFIIDM